MHLFYTPDIATRQDLPEDEAAHCIRVLRLSMGDEVMLTDGKGSFFRAELSAVTGKRCCVTVLEEVRQEPLWRGRLRLAVAPTKNMDRIEWLAEKATEIGVDEIHFLDCRYSERRVLKTDRIDKIVVSAMKQSLKARKPVVGEMTPFKRFVSQDFSGQKFIAHCHEGEKPLLQDVLVPGRDALVMIGPEGDFSEEEVMEAFAQGFIPISLGKSRLRTETAALVAVHIMNMINETRPYRYRLPKINS